MQDRSEAAGGERRLAEAIREVKNRAADRDDVVVELREASRTRLELLAAELAPVFAEVPAEIDLFDFGVSAGLQPRLWIDSVAHVALGRDRRTYRFLRDTRAGRVVLAEGVAMPPVVEAVTRYVAERIVERERALDGTALHHHAAAQPAVLAPQPATVAEAVAEARAAAALGPPSAPSALTRALAVVGTGALVGFALSVVVFWDRVAAAARVLAG